jgi:hypothetical protein
MLRRGAEVITVTPQAVDELKSMKEQAMQQCGEHACGDHTCGDHACGVHPHTADSCEGHTCEELSGSEALLRIIPLADGRVGLILDMFRDGDRVVEHDGEKILVVGPELGDSLDGLVFDCVDTEAGRQLTIYGADSKS